VLPVHVPAVGWIMQIGRQWFLHLDSVSTNYGKSTVKYRASKIWNQLPSALKEFFPVKYFSNKLKEFLQAVDIDGTL